MGKILVIEDNDEINRLLYEVLTQSGHEAVQAFSGTEGLRLFSAGQFELVLLDLMLPGMSGEEVLQEIRKDSEVPVIIISAKSDIDGKVSLLETGADDYITKPFDTREVAARVSLQLKKGSGTSDTTVEFEDVKLDRTKRLVTVNGNPLSLTLHEYNILEVLISHPQRVYSKQELFEQAWDEYYVGEDKTINVHISNIRKKIKELSRVDHIDTVWGIGFRWV